MAKYFHQQFEEARDKRFGEEPSLLEKALIRALRIRKAIRDTQPEYYKEFNL